MWTVWKAPATLSGMSLVRARRISRQRGQLLLVPAATIWPLPLLLAAVRPWASRAAEHVFRITADDGRHRCWGQRRWPPP